MLASNFVVVISFTSEEASLSEYRFFGSTLARASFCFFVNFAIASVF